MATLQFSQDGRSPPDLLNSNKQLLNNIVDGTAKVRPSAIYAEIPRSFESYAQGYRTITYRALANAVNGIAWWLHDILGPGRDHQTLAYLGPNDVSYVMMILGAVKAGYKLLLISPINAVNDSISLFEATDCRVILAPIVRRSPAVQAIRDVHSMRVLDSPSLEDLLSQRYSHYPYGKTFAEARKEPLVVLHTSGTTAVPKPITFSHDFAASYIQWSQLVPPPGYESQVSLAQSNRFLVSVPFFHAGNLFASLFDAIANQTTVITPLAGAKPSAQVTIDGLKQTKADGVLLPPYFVEQIAKDRDMLDFVTKNLETVTYGGGDVAQWSGDALAPAVQMFNFYGSTETGSIPLLRPSGEFPSQDWKYIHPHPAAGLEFQPSAHGLYEAVIVRNQDYEHEQPVFKIFPHLDEYRTRDLWAPHPTKADLWTHRGRADDTIAFKTAYMCDPIPMEQKVAQHPGVQAVLMAGTGRLQPALIVERTGDQALSPAAAQELISELWPLVNEANQ
ncbi:MAG: hypothetical protein Q9196_007318, partial [Gyalolechia fulgens]